MQSVCLQIWKTQQWLQDWKKSVFIPTQRKAMPKNVPTTTQLHSSHRLAKYSSKFQARLQQHINCELPDIQAGFRKGIGTRDQIASIHWIILKARVPVKLLLLLYWLCQSLWLCGSQQTVENSRDGNIRQPDLPLEKSVCRSRSNS